MADTNSLPTTKISKTIQMIEFVLEGNILERVDEIAKQSIDNEDKQVTVFSITTKDDEILKFDSFENFLDRANSEPRDVSSISLQYITPSNAGISIIFSQKGYVELSAYSNALDFQFNIDRLTRELRRCEQEYNWFVKTFILKTKLSQLLLALIFAFSFFLLSSIGYYFYALNVGVNIDPTIIPSGNEYFQQVEDAIRSDDLAQKIDVLLLAELKGFKNVQDILIRQQKLITYSLIILIITAILYLLLDFVRKLYPPGFFAFTFQQTKLADLNRKREIVWVGVVIGFLVNIIAGFMITMVG